MTKAQQKAKAKEHMRDLKGWKAWYKNLGENDKVIEIAERQFQYRCFLVEMEIATNKEIDKWENTWENTWEE